MLKIGRRCREPLAKPGSRICAVAYAQSAHPIRNRDGRDVPPAGRLRPRAQGSARWSLPYLFAFAAIATLNRRLQRTASQQSCFNSLSRYEAAGNLMKRTSTWTSSKNGELASKSICAPMNWTSVIARNCRWLRLYSVRWKKKRKSWKQFVTSGSKRPMFSKKQFTLWKNRSFSFLRFWCSAWCWCLAQANPRRPRPQRVKPLSRRRLRFWWQKRIRVASLVSQRWTQAVTKREAAIHCRIADCLEIWRP